VRVHAQTLADLLRTSLPLHGDRPALRVDGQETSYRELFVLACRCLGGLRALGVRPGDRVALLMPNSLEYVAADLAVAMLGAVKVPLNELLTAADVAYMLKHAGAQLLVAHESLRGLVEPGVGGSDGRPWPSTTVVWTGSNPDLPAGLSWAELLEVGTDTEPPTDVDPHTAALIMYTGGTTGRPKGVLHDQQALATNLLAHIVCGEILEDEQMLLATPLPHSAGFHLQACLVQGGTVELLRRYDPDAVIDAIVSGRVTWTFMVPTMIHRLLDRLRARGLARLTGLRTLVYGAAPITARKLEEALGTLGPVLIQLYGQTEAPNYLTRLSKRDHLDPALVGSCGRAVPTAEVRIIDDTGAPVAPGTIGEVTARTCYSLKAYYGDEGKTAEAYTGQWLRTGDLGYQNEQGYVFLVDRAKDMIISGGMNVYSCEVESAVQALDGVAQVMVVGLPDEDWGEAVTACVVREPGASLPEAAVVTHCRKRLAAYKVPKRVLFLEALPLTRYSKPDKKALRDQLVLRS
jgi:fatty-acyl-CoA synthase/long-chain acyl-CoA synthetase